MAFNSVEDAVQAIADELAAMEAAANDANMASVKDAFISINKSGNLGTLESLALASEYTAIVSDFRAKLWAYHSKLTKRAQELNIDIPDRDGGR